MNNSSDFATPKTNLKIDITTQAASFTIAFNNFINESTTPSEIDNILFEKFLPQMSILMTEHQKNLKTLAEKKRAAQNRFSNFKLKPTDEQDVYSYGDLIETSESSRVINNISELSTQEKNENSYPGATNHEPHQLKDPEPQKANTFSSFVKHDNPETLIQSMSLHKLLTILQNLGILRSSFLHNTYSVGQSRYTYTIDSNYWSSPFLNSGRDAYSLLQDLITHAKIHELANCSSDQFYTRIANIVINQK